MNNHESIRGGRRAGSSRSSTSDDSHATSSSPTGTLSSVATSSSIHISGKLDVHDDKQATRTGPLSGLVRRASSFTKRFSKDKKNAALVDEPTSYFVVPEAEETLKGWKIAFAGANGEHGSTIANILREANLGFTGIPNSLAGSSSSSSPSPASSYSSRFQRVWTTSESSGNMAEILSKLDNPHSLFHTSHTPAELEHFAHMMGGLDALVIDLRRSQRDPHQKALKSASSLIDPLVPALSVPHQPSLWSAKGKNVSGREDEQCQCGRVSPVPSHGVLLGSPNSADTSEHGVLLASRLCRVLSGGSTTSNHCPLSRKVSTPSTGTPSPAEPIIPYARIVLIAEADSQIQPVIGYFESLQALSSEQITNKLIMPRGEPVHPHPQVRSSSPHHHHDGSSTSSRGSHSQRTHRTSTQTMRSDSVESSKPVEIEHRVNARPRRLKPIILEASLAEEFLKPALLGKFDMLNGVWFASSRLPEMKRAII